MYAMQRFICQHFVAKSHLKTALIIIDPPSLNQALCLGQGFEPVDIAAQGKSIADDVRAIEARQISKQQCLLHSLHPLHFPMMPLTGFPPFVAIVADVAVRSGSNIGGRV